MLSFHTSPLVQPGSGDSGGMNVYVREVASALAQGGVRCTTYTRADRAGLPAVVHVEPGHRVVHVPAGPFELAKEQLAEQVDVFADGVAAHIEADGGVDVVHGNYWLSGVVGHRLKHRLDVPLVSTFHTLARVKAEGGDLEPPWRDRAEAEVIGCSDAICVSCPDEASASSGVSTATRPASSRSCRRPSSTPSSRRATAPAHGGRSGCRPTRPLVLFVGRIQPLKAPDLAIRALAALGPGRPDARLVIVGGASGADGTGYASDVRTLALEVGVADRVHFVEPAPHHILSSYYRAADVVIVPSRSESFGLVALEAAACGVPVVASAVGGLLDVVVDGVTGGARSWS